MSILEDFSANKIKRRRRRRDIAEGFGIVLLILGCVAVLAGLLGLAVFIIRYAWTLAGSL